MPNQVEVFVDKASNEDVEHYGRKGMKWYQSIYGSKDKKSSGSSGSKKSTSSPKAKVRMSELSKKQKAKEAKKQEAEKRSAERKAQAAAKRREEILRSPSKLYKHRREFTQDEINTAIRTFEWEKKLSDLSAARRKAGEEQIRSMVNYSVNAINLYNQAARVANSFNLTEKPWTYIEAPGSKKDDKNKKK